MDLPALSVLEGCKVLQVWLVQWVLLDRLVTRVEMEFLAMKASLAQLVPMESQGSLEEEALLALQGSPCPVLRGLLDHQALQVNLHCLTVSTSFEAMSIIRKPS